MTGGGAVVTRLGGIRTRGVPRLHLVAGRRDGALVRGLLATGSLTRIRLGCRSFVALLDSVPSIDDAGALADASDEFFVVSSAGAAAVSSGFCADVSVALPSAAESEEVAVFAGALAANYIRELVDRKEHDPGDDLISRLASDYVATGRLNRETAAITGAVMMQAPVTKPPRT